MQRFTIQTLIDITQTKQFRHQPGEDLAKHQQQNFSVLLQTIGLRANPIFTSGPRIEERKLDDLTFGSAYNGIHKVWVFTFDIEYEGAFATAYSDHELLSTDLHFVPVITGLNETINTRLAVFDTTTSDFCNTVVYTGS